MRANEGRPTPPVWILAFAATLLFSGSPSLADKLVLFKNGKVMRVKSVEVKDGWTNLHVGAGVMGVRDAQILAVEDAGDGKQGKDDPLPNQASVGGGRGGSGGAPGGGNEAYEPEPPQPTEADEAPPPEDTGPTGVMKAGGVRRGGIPPGAQAVQQQQGSRGVTRSRFGAQPPPAPLGGGRMNSVLQEKAAQLEEEPPPPEEGDE